MVGATIICAAFVAAVVEQVTLAPILEGLLGRGSRGRRGTAHEVMSCQRKAGVNRLRWPTFIVAITTEAPVMVQSSGFSVAA